MAAQLIKKWRQTWSIQILSALDRFRQYYRHRGSNTGEYQVSVPDIIVMSIWVIWEWEYMHTFTVCMHGRSFWYWNAESKVYFEGLNDIHWCFSNCRRPHLIKPTTLSDNQFLDQNESVICIIIKPLFGHPLWAYVLRHVIFLNPLLVYNMLQTAHVRDRTEWWDMSNKKQYINNVLLIFWPFCVLFKIVQGQDKMCLCHRQVKMFQRTIWG